MKTTNEEDTQDEVEIPDDMATSGDEPETKEEGIEGEEGYKNSEVKVPEEFQKEAMALVEGCKTIACLDFLNNEVNEMRQKLMSSQKKAGLNRDDFSAEEMPSEG